MKELSEDYEISVDNMVSIKIGLNWMCQNFGFYVREAEFYNSCNKSTHMPILDNGDGEQIFRMKDGIFILEKEINGEVNYFYSNNIEDLYE